MKEKAALRRTFKALRAQVPPETRERAGRRLAETVLDFEPFRRAVVTAAFASARTEIPTDSLVMALRASGRLVLLPRVLTDTNRMVVCEFEELDALDLDRFGVRAPNGPAFTGALDIVFVPGLAFGRDGSRLGYGGGHYDRFLASDQCRGALLCGLGYDIQVVESLPTEAHDVRLTHIATPRQVLPCRRG